MLRGVKAPLSAACPPACRAGSSCGGRAVQACLKRSAGLPGRPSGPSRQAGFAPLHPHLPSAAAALPAPVLMWTSRSGRVFRAVMLAAVPGAGLAPPSAAPARPASLPRAAPAPVWHGAFRSGPAPPHLRTGPSSEATGTVTATARDGKPAALSAGFPSCVRAPAPCGCRTADGVAAFSCAVVLAPLAALRRRRDMLARRVSSSRLVVGAVGPTRCGALRAWA